MMLGSMFRYHFLLLAISAAIIFSSSFPVWAQTLVVPELLQQLDAQKHRSPESVLEQLQQQQDVFVDLTKTQQAFWLNIEATVYSHLGRYPEQQQAAQRGLALLEEQPSLLQVELLLELGYAREMQLALTEALTLYRQASDTAIALENNKLRIRAMVNIAAIDTLQDRDQQALQALKQAYQEASTLQDKELLAEVNAQLGLMYSSLAFEQEAQQFLEQALTLYDELGWQRNKVTVLYNLARNYSYLENFELALQSFDRMLQSAQIANDLLSMYYAYSGLAITSNEMGRPQIALNYMEKAEEYLNVIQSAYYLSGHHYEKALIYQKLQQNSLALQQLQLSEEYLQKLEHDDPGNMLLALQLLKSELFAEQGQYQRAYQNLQAFVRGFQQFRDKENEIELAKLRMGFEAERELARQTLLEQELQVKALRLAEINRARQIQWMWLAIAMGIIALILALFMLVRKNQQQRRKLELTKQEKS